MTEERSCEEAFKQWSATTEAATALARSLQVDGFRAGWAARTPTLPAGSDPGGFKLIEDALQPPSSMTCEEHPWLFWPHDNCAGPGQEIAQSLDLLRRRVRPDWPPQDLARCGFEAGDRPPAEREES